MHREKVKKGVLGLGLGTRWGFLFIAYPGPDWNNKSFYRVYLITTLKSCVCFWVLLKQIHYTVAKMNSDP